MLILIGKKRKNTGNIEVCKKETAKVKSLLAMKYKFLSVRNTWLVRSDKNTAKRGRA